MAETKRRKILIDKKFQLHYLRIWLFTGLGLVIVSITFFFLARAYLGSFSNPIMLRMIIGVSVFIILFCLLMGLLSVAMTHHVAGAAYRLQLGVDELLSGDFSREIKLRKGDYLQKLATGLNTLSGRLKNRRDSTQQLASELESLRKKLDGTINDEQKKSINDICAQIRALVEDPPAPAKDAPKSA